MPGVLAMVMDGMIFVHRGVGVAVGHSLPVRVFIRVLVMPGMVVAVVVRGAHDISFPLPPTGQR
ncbi:hypothetical protein GCM10025784_05120 [Citricoccus nitrophenolicus]